jgi:hypothetical protein
MEEFLLFSSRQGQQVVVSGANDQVAKGIKFPGRILNITYFRRNE